MVSSPKKPITKSATQRGTAKKSGAVSSAKTQHVTHPSWVDMIKECVIAHPEDARAGVSRPTIKKFVEAKYNLEMTPAATSQLSRAIAHGVERGTFVLPKGPTGRVKLPPKGHKEATKENTPVPKKMPLPAKAATKSKPAKKAAPVAVSKKPSAPKVKVIKKPTIASKFGTKASTTGPKAGSAPKKLLARMVNDDEIPPKKRGSAAKTSTSENVTQSKATQPRPKATTTKKREGKPVSADKTAKPKPARRASVSKKASEVPTVSAA
ncbi:hypothetical protein OF83DRAFT_1171176 [Amylostereum chailletii]|nr:hypothetical protein OF83DRAFT_1171176 [Amylostereum chailletii]